MAVPTKDEALATLREGDERLRELFDMLTLEQFAAPATIGGGDWSAADLAAHIGTWEELALEALEAWRAGRKPRVEQEVFGVDGGIDRFNDEAVARKRAADPAGVRRQAGATHADLVKAIETMPEDQWRSKVPYEADKRTDLAALLGSIIGAPQRPFGHAFAHLPDLTAYVASVSAQAPPAG
jgi:hypothetical protein